MNADTHTKERPDYELAREELAALYASLKLKVSVEYMGRETDADKWEHDRWSIAIGKRILTYKMGTGHNGKEPNPYEVLASYCRDGLDADEPFAEWARTFGYSDDSISALRTYKECRKNKRTALLILNNNKELLAQFAELSSRL